MPMTAICILISEMLKCKNKCILELMNIIHF